MNPVTPQMPEKPSLQGGMNLTPLFRFAGRDSRAAWWGIQIVGFLALLFFVSVFLGIDGAIEDDYSRIRRGEADEPRLLADLFLAATFIAYFVVALASNVRRLHDRGKSGVWLFLTLVPIVGSIWLIVELGMLPGEGANEYGR